MILLADGGSTKVDWRLIDGGKEIKQIYTKGANPFFRDTEDIAEELKSVLKPELGGNKVDSVYFFGAGCANPEKNKVVSDAITQSIGVTNVEVYSDLLAAARGLCGHSKGIACIIGTGANSCFYDGKDIVENVSPLGYILGDEGSGAVLGRLFLGSCLKNQLTKGLKEEFLKEYDLTPMDIIEKVYRQPMANRFLASLSPFILKHITDPTVNEVVYNSFADFFKKNVMQYDYKSNQVHLTGSVAYHYQEVLKKVASDMNIKLGTIISSPMEGLVKYYAEINK